MSAGTWYAPTEWPPSSLRVFPAFDWCPGWCAGHVDDSVSDTHHTVWEYFGPDGVVVVQIDGQAAAVSLADVDLEAARTAEQEQLLAFQIGMAERFAARQPIWQPQRELASAGSAVSR